MRLQEDLDSRKEVRMPPSHQNIPTEKSEVPILYMILLSCLTLVIGIITGRFL